MVPIAGNEAERGILLDSTITAEEYQKLTAKFLAEKPFQLLDMSTKMQNQLQDLIKKSEIFRESTTRRNSKNFFDPRFHFGTNQVNRGTA